MSAAATVLVIGPPRAGVTSMAACLRQRMPDVTFVESGGPAVAPVAVVFVVSAVAPITESDCALAEQAAGSTDAVVAVLAKIDDHRGWREVLTASRERLAGRSARFSSVPWVGAAAAPRLGEPAVDDVVGVLTAMLADPETAWRNTLRGWETGLCAVIAAVRAAVTDPDRRAQVEALGAHRDALVRARRLAASKRSAAARHPIQHARLELMFTARDRCTAMRTELLAAAAEATRAGVVDVVARVQRRCTEVTAELDELICVRLQELAAELGADPLPAAPRDPDHRIGTPPLRRRPLESRLTTVVGAGFGFGVGLVVTRLVTGLAPELTVAGSLVGAAVGLILTLWVVATRAVLHDRGVLAHWINEAVGTVRTVLEERIATRVLAAEAGLTEARLAAALAEDGRMAERVAAFDAELRELGRADGRAKAVRGRCEPGLARALAAVRHGLRDADADRRLVTGR